MQTTMCMRKRERRRKNKMNYLTISKNKFDFATKATMLDMKKRKSKSISKSPPFIFDEFTLLCQQHSYCHCFAVVP